MCLRDRMWAVLFFEPRFFLHLFTNEPELIQKGIPAMRLYFCGIFMMALQFSGQSTYLSLIHIYVKHTLKLGTVKIFGNMEQSVSRLAISPGSGKSAVSAAIRKKADVLVTGDIGHHDGLDAVEQGLSIIDAGHYGTCLLYTSKCGMGY